MKTKALREKVGFAGLAALLLFGAGYVGAGALRSAEPVSFESFSEAPPSTQLVAAPAQPDVASVPVEEPRLAVHIVGAVQHPGVYKLLPGVRVEEALAAAGGALPEADTVALNFAAEVRDGTQLYVPVKQIEGAYEKASSEKRKKAQKEAEKVAKPYRGGPTEAGAYAQAAPNEFPPAKQAVPVQVNVADAQGMQGLPGVGPVIAERIVAYRKANGPFQNVEDLLAVEGIGPKKLEAMRAYVRL